MGRQAGTLPHAFGRLGLRVDDVRQSILGNFPSGTFPPAVPATHGHGDHTGFVTACSAMFPFLPIRAKLPLAARSSARAVVRKSALPGTACLS